jgi:hypothetical protein
MTEHPGLEAARRHAALADPPPDDPGPAEPASFGRRLRITRGSQVNPERLEWWEPGLVLKASINLLAAREGKGKSTVASSWAARETRSGGTVLWIGTEESRAHAQVPRLIAAGADMDRIIFIDVETDLGTGALVFPIDLVAVESVIAEHAVTMIVLDPCKGLVPPGFSGNDDIAVRQYLEPIAALVARRNVVLIGLAHFGKRDGNDTGKLLLGSVAWSQVARTVLSIAENPDTDTRVLSNTKSNYTAVDRSVEFRITGVTVPSIDVEWGTVEWLGDTTVDARDLLAGRDDDDDAGERTAAEHWLEDYLTENGPTPSRTVKAEAAKEKISERTLKRAKKILGVMDRSEGFPRTSIWELADRSDSQLSGGPTGGVSCQRGPTGPTEPDQQKPVGPTGPNSQSGHAHTSGPTGGPTGAEVCRHCGEPLVYDDDKRDGYHSSKTACAKAQQTHQRAQLSIVGGATRPKASCQKWFNRHIDELRAGGQSTVESFAVYRAGEVAGYTRGNLSQAASNHPDVVVIARDGRGATWSITGERDNAYTTAAEFVDDYLSNLDADSAEIDQDHFRQAVTAAGYSWETAAKAATRHPRIESVKDADDGRKTVWRITPKEASA